MGNRFIPFERRTEPGPPRGLTLRRTAGYNLAAASLAANGRPAVMVARPSEWGNPFSVGLERSAAEAVERFEETLLTWTTEKLEEYLAPLRGKNLACWCSQGKPCHRDVLLRLANRTEPKP